MCFVKSKLINDKSFLVKLSILEVYESDPRTKYLNSKYKAKDS